MAVIILLNNFLHDFGAAGWLVGGVVLWTILSKHKAEVQRNHAFREIVRHIILLMNLSLIGIVLFGAVRALAYRTYEWNPAAGNNQVTLLLVKHALLTIVFILGLVQYIRARNILKEHSSHAKEQ
jgi:putative copper export protein